MKAKQLESHSGWSLRGGRYTTVAARITNSNTSSRSTYMQIFLCNEFEEDTIQKHLSQHDSNTFIYYRDVASKIKYHIPRTVMILAGCFQLEIFHDILLYHYRSLRTIGGQIRNTQGICEDFLTGGCTGFADKDFLPIISRKNILSRKGLYTS